MNKVRVYYLIRSIFDSGHRSGPGRHRSIVRPVLSTAGMRHDEGWAEKIAQGFPF